MMEVQAMTYDPDILYSMDYNSLGGGIAVASNTQQT